MYEIFWCTKVHIIKLLHNLFGFSFIKEKKAS